MDLKQRIATAEAAIAKVQLELNSLHNEAQILQRAGYEPPSSTEPIEVARAARRTAERQTEAQRQLGGVHAATGSLQAILKGYLSELSALRLQEKELEQLRLKREAKAELERCGAVLNDLSAQMQDAMQQTHRAGLRLNNLQGLGNTVKYQLAVNSLPFFTWERGCHYISGREVKFNQADDLPLAKQFPVNPGQAQQPVNKLQLQTDANALEVRIGELKEEITVNRIKLKNFENFSRGPEVSWAASLRYAIGQKEPMLEQAEAKLQELKSQLGAVNVVAR